MNKILTASKILTSLSLITLINLSGCEDSETATAPNGPKIKNADNMEFIVIGNNSESIAKHSEQRDSAKAYLEKLEASIDEIRAMEQLVPGPDQVEQDRKMAALADEGDQFGILFEPLTHCRSAGISADAYWAAATSQTRGRNLTTLLKYYQEYAAKCRSEIENAPTPTTSILGTSDQKTPPFTGCIALFSLSDSETYTRWSCPSESIPKTLGIREVKHLKSRENLNF